MRNVEAWIAVKLPPGPYLLEHTVKKGNVFRNIVAWCGGPLPVDFSLCSNNPINHHHPVSAQFFLPQPAPQFTNHDNVMLTMINGLAEAQELTLRRTTSLEEKFEELSKFVEKLEAKETENQASKDCHKENILREATNSPLDQKYEDARETSKETDYEDVISYVSRKSKKKRNRKKNKEKEQRESYRHSVLLEAALGASSLPPPKKGSLRQAALACVQHLQADSAQNTFLAHLLSFLYQAALLWHLGSILILKLVQGK